VIISHVTRSPIYFWGSLAYKCFGNLFGLDKGSIYYICGFCQPSRLNYSLPSVIQSCLRLTPRNDRGRLSYWEIIRLLFLHLLHIRLLCLREWEWKDAFCRKGIDIPLKLLFGFSNRGVLTCLLKGTSNKPMFDTNTGYEISLLNIAMKLQSTSLCSLVKENCESHDHKSGDEQGCAGEVWAHQSRNMTLFIRISKQQCAQLNSLIEGKAQICPNSLSCAPPVLINGLLFLAKENYSSPHKMSFGRLFRYFLRVGERAEVKEGRDDKRCDAQKGKGSVECFADLSGHPRQNLPPKKLPCQSRKHPPLILTTPRHHPHKNSLANDANSCKSQDGLSSQCPPTHNP
jgi:hypothetical protein